MSVGQNMGASADAETGSRASTEPSSTVSALTGFDPARWEVGEIPVACSDGKHIVAGWVSGLFGLDWRPRAAAWGEDDYSGEGCWALTHLPTGHAIVRIVAPLARAKEIAAEFAAIGDWDFVINKPPEPLKKPAQGLKAKFSDELTASSAILPVNPAQGIEAQRAATTKIGSVADESPVAESDAPKGGPDDTQ